jgi:hypothetical protein
MIPDMVGLRLALGVGVDTTPMAQRRIVGAATTVPQWNQRLGHVHVYHVGAVVVLVPLPLPMWTHPLQHLRASRGGGYEGGPRTGSLDCPLLIVRRRIITL